MTQAQRSIVIVGVSGFIGRALADRASRRAFDVIGVGRTSPENAPTHACKRYIQADCRETDWQTLIADLKPSAVVFAAGKASVPLSFSDPSEDFQQNVIALQRLLHACIRAQTPPYVTLLSSAAVYGQPRQIPTPETSPIAPMSPYGFHKAIGELLAQEAAQCFGLRVVSARIFSAYGPGLRRQLLWDIARKALSPGEVELFGTGKETRDFLYISDVAEALLLLVEAQLERAFNDFTPINIGSGISVSVREVARILLQSLGQPAARLSFSETGQIGAPENWCADITTLASLGFHPRVDFREGARRYAKWITQEHQT
jgi:UDP-glucose 4-epimerase